MIRSSTVLTFILLTVLSVAAQTDKFDIVTYSIPAGWEVKKGTDTVQFTKEDKATNGFCIVTLYRSVNSVGGARANFDAAWSALVNETLKTDAKPQMGTPGLKDGWSAELGLAPVTTSELKGAALLTTATGNGKMISVLVLMNTDAFQKETETLIDSIKLPPVKAVAAQSTASTAPAAGESARLIGKWQRSSSGVPTYGDPVSWGTAGYTKSRYEFKADGTYVYTERSFRMMMQTIIVVRENGKFAINGSALTITPEKSTISSYKKDGGVDALGALVKTQNRELETVTYKFSFHYFEGIKEWDLVLQADRTTGRDGPFSNNPTFPNAWYFDQQYTDKDLTAPRI